MSRYEPPTDAPRTYIPTFDVAAQFSLPQRTAILLHPRRIEVPDLFASKVGGRCAWPRGEPWPMCTEENNPFVNVMQLTKADVPQLPFPDGKDLFQLLWCPGDHEETDFSPLSRIYWRNSHEIEPVHAPPFHGEYYNRYHVPLECKIFPESIQETEPYPENEEEISEWVVQNAQQDLEFLKVPESYYVDAYSSLFSCSPGTKIGGYPAFVQDPYFPDCSCGQTMSHLLTVSSNDLGDGGSWFRWAPNDMLRNPDGTANWQSKGLIFA